MDGEGGRRVEEEGSQVLGDIQVLINGGGKETRYLAVFRVAALSSFSVVHLCSVFFLFLFLFILHLSLCCFVLCFLLLFTGIDCAFFIIQYFFPNCLSLFVSIFLLFRFCF